MLEFLTQSPLIFYAIVLLMSFLSASIGTGGGFILIPLAALFFGAKEGVGILTLYFLFQNSSKILLFRSHIHTKIGVRLILFAVPGAMLGSIALGFLPVELFKKIFAVIILVYLANELFGLIPKRGLRERHTVPIFGFAYGFLSGLVGSGNLIKGPLFLGMGLSKEAYIATYAFTSFFINIPKIATYAATGIIDGAIVRQSLPFLFISIVGTVAGRHFIRQIHHDVFIWILNITFVIAALGLLLE
jgi:uncharacterized protein